MDSVQESSEEATRFYDETPAVDHENQMAGQGDQHGDSQTSRTPFYGRPPDQKDSPLDRTPSENANRSSAEADSLLAATIWRETPWPPSAPV